MTEQNTSNMVPEKPFYAIVRNINQAQLYDNSPKRVMPIDCCEICRHRIEGAEDGGPIIRVEGVNDDISQKDIWYYCAHKQYANWPKRIGQSDKLKEIPYFCPLDILVKVNDSLIKVDAKARRAAKSGHDESGKTETATSSAVNDLLND